MENKKPRDSMASRNNTIVVAIGVDDKVVYPALILLYSLSVSTTSPFRVEIGFFEGHLKEKNRRAIEVICGGLGIQIEFREFPFLANLFISKRHITPTTFLKFLFADEITEAFVWLDVDVIVLPGWESIFDEMASPVSPFELVVAHKADPTAKGFNAGVLGWPAKKIRREWRESVLASASEGFSLEQDIFNRLYADVLHWLPVSYNYVSLWENYQEGLPSDIKILHYAGPLKPWFLKPSLAHSCIRAECSWKIWFRFQELFHGAPELTDVGPEMKALRESALDAYSDFTRRLPFFRLVRACNSWFGQITLFPIVAAVWALREKSIPNSHPFHGK